MKFTFPLFGALLVASVVTTTAVAQDKIDPAIEAAINARQSHMTLYAFNLAPLGDMAKGEIAYNADVATAAAENLAALARIDESRYWLPGSDMATLGKEHTKALKETWAEGSKIGSHVEKLIETSADMAKAAGNGLASLRTAMIPLGKSCSGCHEDFRAATDE